VNAEHETDAGWGWPVTAKRAHYFKRGRALCGSWIFLTKAKFAPSYDGPDACAMCTRRLRAALAKAQGRRNLTAAPD
jgi:hypothetical protein